MSIIRSTLTLNIELTSPTEEFDLEAVADYSGAPVKLRAHEILIERQGGYLAVKVTGVKYRADGKLGTATTSSTMRGKDAQDAFVWMPEQLRQDISAHGIRVPGIPA